MLCYVMYVCMYIYVCVDMRDIFYTYDHMMYSYPICFISPTKDSTVLQPPIPTQPQRRTAGLTRWTCAVYAGRGQNLAAPQLEISND